MEAAPAEERSAAAQERQTRPPAEVGSECDAGWPAPQARAGAGVGARGGDVSPSDSMGRGGEGERNRGSGGFILQVDFEGFRKFCKIGHLNPHG